MRRGRSTGLGAEPAAVTGVSPPREGRYGSGHNKRGDTSEG